MSTEVQQPSSNQPPTSCVNSNNENKVEAHNSNVSISQGNNNTIIQGVPLSKIPPERIEYNVKDPIQSFIGRENILRELHDAIEQNRLKQELTILSQTNVVSGLGGVGKSETVKKYIQQYKETYCHILWINAETLSQARDCVISIASITNVISFNNIDGIRKKDEELAAEVYAFICKKPAFIVFDNANSLLNEDGEEGIGALLPRNLQSRAVKPAIVVTSRNRKWSGCYLIQLSGFDDREIYTLLSKQLKFLETSENRSLAAKIAHLCDGLPLVIQQVIRVIKIESDEREAIGEDPYSMQDFIRNYHEENKNYVDEIPDDVPVELGVSYTVYKVFNLTFQKISKKREGVLVLKCLNIFSLLNPDGIPVDLFLSFFDVNVKDRVSKALALLLKYNLLNIVGKCYTVHRMLQKVRIEMLKHLVSCDTNVLCESIISSSRAFCGYLQNVRSINSSKFIILENGIRLANLIFSEKCGSAARSYLLALADKCVKYGKYYNAIYIFKSLVDNRIGNAEEILDYEIKLAQTYRLEGKLLESELMYKNLLACDVSKIEHCTSVNPQKHILIQGLAEVYSDQGKYALAESLFKYLHKYEKQLFGDSHTNALAIERNLAKVLKNQGKYSETEQFYIKILKSHVNILGSKPPSPVSPENKLAEFYDETVIHNAKLLNTEMNILDPEYPNNVVTKYDLAMVFKNQGKYSEAKELFTELSMSLENSLGCDHHSTLATKHQLAMVFEHQGKYSAAEELYVAVLKSREGILGHKHPATLETKYNLADVFEKQKNYNKAEKLYTELLKPLVNNLGPEHPNTWAAKSNLAATFESQGKYSEAEEMYTSVLTSMEVCLGSEHPNVLTTKQNLASVLASQGKYSEAEDLYTTTLKSTLAILGCDHLSALTIKHSLAKIFKNQGKSKEAENLFTEVLKSQVNILGPEHPETLTTKYDLAGTFEKRQKYTDAEKLYSEVLKSRMVVLGPEHRDTLLTKHNLEEVIIWQGNR